MPFSASTIFCFTYSTSAKHFPLRIFFVQGNKKSHWGWGMGVMLFLVKNCWTFSMVWAGMLINHPSWNGKMNWIFKKNLLRLNTASDNTTSWYSDTDGFLEHSLSRGSLNYEGSALQKVIPGFLGPSSYVGSRRWWVKKPCVFGSERQGVQVHLITLWFWDK